MPLTTTYRDTAGSTTKIFIAGLIALGFPARFAYADADLDAATNEEDEAEVRSTFIYDDKLWPGWTSWVACQ